MKRFTLIPTLSLALSLFLSGCHNPPCTLHASSTSEAEAWGIAMPPTPCFTGVPSFPGGGLRAHSDCADGFEQALFRGTTAAMFTDFKTRLGAAGFGRFAQNELNRNLFATYTNDGHIVHAYFTPASEETRVIAARGALLPAIGAARGAKVVEPSVTLLGLAVGGSGGGLGMLLQFEDGSFIMNLCDTPEQTQYIKGGTKSFNRVRQTIADSYAHAKVHKALTGQVYRFPGCEMEVLNCMSDFLPQVIGLECDDADRTNGDGNIQSLVVRFRIGGQTIMVTGDVAKVSVDQMCQRFGDYLASDIFTVPHHGWNENRYRARNGTIEFYRHVNPAMVLWPDSDKGQARKMAWDGTPGGNWEANHFLVNSLNVKKLIVAGKRTVTLALPVSFVD